MDWVWVLVWYVLNESLNIKLCFWNPRTCQYLCSAFSGMLQSYSRKRKIFKPLRLRTIRLWRGERGWLDTCLGKRANQTAQRLQANRSNLYSWLGPTRPTGMMPKNPLLNKGPQSPLSRCFHLCTFLAWTRSSVQSSAPRTKWNVSNIWYVELAINIIDKTAHVL